MQRKKTIKPKNVPAATLADPRYQARVVKNAKVYSRKNKTAPGEDEDA